MSFDPPKQTPAQIAVHTEALERMQKERLEKYIAKKRAQNPNWVPHNPWVREAVGLPADRPKKPKKLPLKRRPNYLPTEQEAAGRNTLRACKTRFLLLMHKNSYYPLFEEIKTARCNLWFYERAKSWASQQALIQPINNRFVLRGPGRPTAKWKLTPKGVDWLKAHDLSDVLGEP